ncbi:MAG: tRNA adenosine(34) deaminase TadA [Oscillospiraceae bacterium]
MTHEAYMSRALTLAETALKTGDVPVGCVVVAPDGTVVGEGYNRREADGDATAHAEVEALRAACKTLGTWRLAGCSLYVTLEPCPMCAGAIVNARISKVFYGAKDDKAGCCGSVLNLFEERFNHKPAIVGGILKEDCAQLLQRFFLTLRT